MAKRKGSSAPSCSRARKNVKRDARKVETTQWLDKLPHELWEKILENLDENDLFPLALSCRYLRQKQKELVERTRQSGPESGKPRLALETTLWRKLEEKQPASADYLRFCSKEKVPKDARQKKARYTRCLAAFHGHLPLLQKLLAGLKRFHPQIGMEAARGGQLETLQWLRNQEGFKLALDESIFRIACDGGHLEVLKWLRSEGCRLDAGVCPDAASGGHLEVLKWLRSQGCPWSVYTCAGAARGGQLEVLKWLRSEGCPWNDWTTYWAAVGGRLEILKWAIDNGCPYKVDYSTRPALQSLGLA